MEPLRSLSLAAKTNPSSAPNIPSPFMERGPGGEVQSRGWLFPPETVFDEVRLLTVLRDRTEVTRLKGVLHGEDGWIAVNRSGTETSVKPTAYRRDSRLEVFAEGLDWGAFEAELRGCIKGEPGPQGPRV